MESIFAIGLEKWWSIVILPQTNHYNLKRRKKYVEY